MKDKLPSGNTHHDPAQVDVEISQERELASPHILNAASALLGLCFVVLTSIRLLELSELTHVDEFCCAAIMVFMGSCVVSFLSIRAIKQTRKKRLDSLAVNLFMIGLILLLIISVFVTFRNF